jgi:thiol-disulfide isomerase/thioredoxin
MRSSLVLLLFLLQLNISAQNIDSIKILGQIVPDSGATFKADKADVRMVPYNENESICTTLVNDDGTFTIKVPAATTDIYDLKYKGYKLTLLLSPTEPVYKIIIKTDDKQEVRSMKISGSRENDAYRIFRRENLGFKDLMRDIRNECATNEKACLAKYKKQFSAQNELMDYLEKGYKGTFTASVLANMGRVPELTGASSVVTQLQSGFFDAINLSDTLLYRTSDFNNKISWYIDYVADTSATGRTAFIQHLMDRTKGKKAAQKNLLTLLFNNFLDEYREAYIKSLVQWADGQPGLEKEQPVLAAKLKLLAGVLPGMSAPEVSGEDLKQQTELLSNTAKSNRLTLLIFWESDCPHCRKAMPDFIRLYKQYHSKGLEVFAASLDSDKSKWKLFIDYYHLNWINIVLPENSPVHADYFIQYTPTAVLIDHAGKIVRRFISVEDLDKGIAAFLDK